MRKIFIGRPAYWLLWAAVVAVLSAMGRTQLHVHDFVWFILVLLGLSAACVLAIVLTYRKGERITRQPFEEE